MHLKAVSKASGQTYETDAEAGEKLIVLKNLPENQKYEVEVSAWLKDRAEKTVFQKQEIELNNTLEEAFDICLSDEKVENLNEGTTVGTFTVNEMAPEGNYVFSLCTGEGDTHNPYFAIENGVLKTAKKLEEGKTYTIRLKAKNAEAEIRGRQRIGFQKRGSEDRSRITGRIKYKRLRRKIDEAGRRYDFSTLYIDKRSGNSVFV